MSVGIFNSSIFNNQVFNTGSVPDTSTEIYAGWPADWKRRDSEHWTGRHKTRFDAEIEAIELEAAEKLQEIKASKDKSSEQLVKRQRNEVLAHENIAAYEALARHEIEKREQFTIYEQKMLREINELRIRRARLIRLRQEEEVVLSILLDLPPLH